MKNFLTMFWLNLKEFWKKYKVAFLIVNGFIYFSFLFTILVYNSASYELVGSDIKNYYDYTYRFEINSLDDITKKADKFLSETDNIRCLFFSFDNSENNENSDTIYRQIIYLLYSGNMMEFNSVNYGRYFTNSELSDGTKVILAPNKKLIYSYPIPNYPENSIYKIGEEEFKVIGSNSLSDWAFLMPYNSLTDKTKITSINISVCKKQNTTESKRFIKNVYNIFGEMKLTSTPTKRNIKGELAFGIAYYLIFAISIVNILSMYCFAIQNRKDMLSRFNSNKFSIDDCRKYLYYELGIFIFADYILSIITTNIYVIFAKNIFKQNLRYLEFWEYLIILFAYIIIYFICFSTKILLTTKQMKKLRMIDINN